MQFVHEPIFNYCLQDQCEQNVCRNAYDAYTAMLHSMGLHVVYILFEGSYISNVTRAQAAFLHVYIIEYNI